MAVKVDIIRELVKPKAKCQGFRRVSCTRKAVKEYGGRELCGICRQLAIQADEQTKTYIVRPEGRKKTRRKPRLTDEQFLIQKAKELANRPTAAEVIFRRKLDELEIRYVEQYWYCHGGLKGIFDFYLPDLETVIEVDGGYHDTEEQKQTDAIKDFVCEDKLGFKMVRFTNNQAMYLSIEQIGKLI